jgi:hypothetical protein
MYDIKVDIKTILSDYPLLKYDINNNVIFGEIELESDEGIFIDIFNIDIIIPPCFPKCFPYVIENESKIPRTVKRHVMPETNHLCLAVKTEESLLCKSGITLVWFFDKILIPRLCEEYRVSKGENYQNEYSHDFGGTWEYLMKFFKTESTELVLKFIHVLAEKKKPKGDKLCLCDSGKQFKDCHKKQLVQMLQLKNVEIKELYNVLKNTPYKGVNL